MKTKLIEEAKSLAKNKSLERQQKDHNIYVIFCNIPKRYYIDTDSFIRLWEQIVGYYINGIFISNSNQ